MVRTRIIKISMSSRVNTRWCDRTHPYLHAFVSDPCCLQKVGSIMYATGGNVMCVL